MDCIIVAGNDKTYYKRVASEANKAFLRVGHQTVIQIILGEVAKVQEVDRILIVGPKERLENHLSQLGADKLGKPVLVFEQRANMVNNVLHAFRESGEGQDPDRFVLLMPADIPMVTAAEIREFIGLCDMSAYDFVSGLSTREVLEKFYPTAEQPGIVMNYFVFPHGHYRINNLHMVRPSRCRHIEYIQRMYEMRYQTRFLNMFKMMFWLMIAFFRAPSAPFFYVGMQIFGGLRRRKYKRLAWLVGRSFHLAKAEKYISAILGVRFRAVLTSFGGAAVDVDNDADYRVLLSRHKEWRETLAALAQERDAAAKAQ